MKDINTEGCASEMATVLSGISTEENHDLFGEEGVTEFNTEYNPCSLDEVHQTLELKPAGEALQAPIAQAEPINSMMTIIERVCMNPEADISKLEKMIDLQERILDKNSVQAFASSMSKCQGEMPSVAKQSFNGQTKSNFAKFEHILEDCKPVYARHGFAISFGTEKSEIEKHIRITAEIFHSEGHSKNYFVDLPIDNAGMTGKVNKTLMHGTASTFTYGKRYLFCMIFNIALKDSDNDGNAPPPANISTEQASELKALLQQTNSDVKMFCKVYKVDCVDSLPSTLFNHAKTAIQRKL